MLVEAVGIVAVAAIGGAAAGLHVGDAIGFGPEHAQESFRAHGAGADFDIVGLLNDAAALGPVFFQLEDDRLETNPSSIRLPGRAPSSVCARYAARSAGPGSGAGPRTSSRGQIVRSDLRDRLSQHLFRDRSRFHTQFPTARARRAAACATQQSRAPALEERALRRFVVVQHAAATQANIQLRQKAGQPHRPQAEVRHRAPHAAAPGRFARDAHMFQHGHQQAKEPVILIHLMPYVKSQAHEIDV